MSFQFLNERAQQPISKNYETRLAGMAESAGCLFNNNFASSLQNITECPFNT